MSRWRGRWAWLLKGSKDAEKEESEKPRGESFFLKDLNISFEKGKFYWILGKVGSGNSSLLSAILQGMPLGTNAQSVSIIGKTVYVRRKPWLSSGTIKEKICLASRRLVGV